LTELQFVRLAEVADIESGAGFPLQHQGKHNEKFPFLKVSDMNLTGNERCINRWNNSVSEDTRVQVRARAFPVGAVIFPKIGAAIATNKKRILIQPSCVDNNVMGIIPKTDRLTSEYIYHLLLSTDLSQFASASNPPSIRKGEVENWMIPLPPLDEQRRIVGLLDRAAEIRRRADAARAKARAIIPALFLDLFGDPATNPKGWAVQALSDLADIGSGLTKGRKLNGTPTEPTPYLRVANVQADRLDLSEIKMIDATDDDRVRCRLLPGDLLMTEGGDLDKLGRCAMWQGEVDLCLHQNHIFRVRMGSAIVPDYARAFMQSEAARGYFLRVAKRTTGIASINKTQLGRLPVWVPPLPLQTAFAEQASRLDSLTRALDAAAAKADSMAAALSAEVFG